MNHTVLASTSGTAQIIDLAHVRATRQRLRRRAELNARRRARRQAAMQSTLPRQPAMPISVPLRLAHSRM